MEEKIRAPWPGVLDWHAIIAAVAAATATIDVAGFCFV